MGKEKEYILSTAFLCVCKHCERTQHRKTDQKCYSVRGGSLGRRRQRTDCDFTRYSIGFGFDFGGVFGHGSKHGGSYFTGPGMEPMPSAVEAWSLTTEPPGKFPTGSEICGSMACSKILKKKKKNQPKLLWWHTPIAATTLLLCTIL